MCADINFKPSEINEGTYLIKIGGEWMLYFPPTCQDCIKYTLGHCEGVAGRVDCEKFYPNKERQLWLTTTRKS